MLRTNNKVVRERIRKYIVGNALDALESNWHMDVSKMTETDVLKTVWDIFKDTTKNNPYWIKGRVSEQDLFADYCSGLPSTRIGDHYYGIIAVDLLGDILEQTKSEREKYTEAQAESMLTYLIYSELKKAAESV